MAPEMLLHYVPLLCVLVWVAGQDLAARRIPNYVTLPLCVAGIVQAFCGHTVTPLQCMAGVGVGFGLTFVMFAMNAIYAGDVKLLTAVGAWVGPILTLEVFMAASVVGLVVVLTQAVWQRRLTQLVRNSTLLAASLATADQEGLKQVAEMGPSFRSVKAALPYGVSICAGTFLVLMRAWPEL